MQENTTLVSCNIHYFSIADETGNYEKFTADELFDTIMYPLFDYQNQCFKDVVHTVAVVGTPLDVVLKGKDGKLLVIVRKQGWEMLELCVCASSLDKVFTSYVFGTLLSVLSRNGDAEDENAVSDDLYLWLVGVLFKYSEAKSEKENNCIPFHSLVSLIVKNNDDLPNIIMCGFELT